MPTRNNLGLFILVSTLTTLLSWGGPVFVATVPARYLRLSFGRTAYWLFTVGSAAALFFYSPLWALSQFIVLLLIGLYTDLEQNKLSTFYSGLISVFFAGISLFFLLGTWARAQNSSLPAMIKGLVAQFSTELAKRPHVASWATPEFFIMIFPIAVMLFLMIMVFVSVVLVKPQTRGEKLSAFQVPDVMVWMFILSLAGARLLDKEKYFYINQVAWNMLVFCAAAYYFQGLAIVAVVLKRMRVNYFLKTGLFIMLALQPQFTALLGLSELWFGYRSKWYKKALKDNARRDI